MKFFHRPLENFSWGKNYKPLIILTSFRKDIMLFILTEHIPSQKKHGISPFSIPFKIISTSIFKKSAKIHGSERGPRVFKILEIYLYSSIPFVPKGIRDSGFF